MLDVGPRRNAKVFLDHKAVWWGGLRAHGPSFSLPYSLAYFVGASLLVASCLYLTAHSHSYADVAYGRGVGVELRGPSFSLFYCIISSSATDPLFGAAYAVRNEVDACERIDRQDDRQARHKK